MHYCYNQKDISKVTETVPCSLWEETRCPYWTVSLTANHLGCVFIVLMGVGKGVWSAKQMVPFQSICSYLIVFKPYFRTHSSSKLCLERFQSCPMSVENKEIFCTHLPLRIYNNVYLCCFIFLHAFPSGRVLYLEAHVNLTLE